MKENKELQRNFILGDNWLYYKIYTGYKTSDKILVDVIHPIANRLIDEKIINKWFFIRYGDPKHHLRVRFHFTERENIFKIINSFLPYLKSYIDKKLIWKIQTDTYKREIERYGVNSMCLSEDIFYYDSESIVGFLKVIKGREDEDVRWLFSLRLIDSLLNDFEYNLERKNKLLFELSTSFKNEFNSSKYLTKQLSKKYRDKQDKIEKFMSDRISEVYSLGLLEIIEEKEKVIKPIICDLQEIKKKGELEINLDQLMSSYIHMLMNRLFKSRNRLHEMVCYDFLYRFYKSKLARVKIKHKKTS
ncbi:hypothetical protein F7018_02150 [Tenacibaculum aiptasiae]|uniref:Thiopeptide-type bacteriocin biosynthesis domain-containing protein n=1 Tax=Tenacibaculum aiptasiae TaxID=426481 RepID=A0A7J5AUW5_9FLAO|nr:thiopeptide-type bacteriocin biosynthesis protein [Tenacibaculum aiptasiae]KAB1160700.1 hypothetical protein F7018_02150 [Tenacibaculum aiptasiae]